MMNLTITEPMTLLTDYVMALVCFYFAFQLLHSQHHQTQMSRRIWGIGFLFAAIASVTGGTYHGFLLDLSPLLQKVFWKTSLYSLGVTSFCLIAGTAIATFRVSIQLRIIIFASAQFILYSLWMIEHDDFKYVIINYATALILVLIFQLFQLSKTSAKWILSGIALSFIGAGVQQSGLDLHQNFNHNDLYHVIQIIALCFLYVGSKQLQDFDTNKSGSEPRQ